MSAASGPYVLIQDGDCHWYVCPADKQKEARVYFDATEKYWLTGSSDEDDLPEEPDWLDRVGGVPSLVKFIDYHIDC